MFMQMLLGRFEHTNANREKYFGIKHCTFLCSKLQSFWVPRISTSWSSWRASARRSCVTPPTWRTWSATWSLGTSIRWRLGPVLFLWIQIRPSRKCRSGSLVLNVWKSSYNVSYHFFRFLKLVFDIFIVIFNSSLCYGFLGQFHLLTEGKISYVCCRRTS